jgi:Cu-Zn family superoxide dismutase
MRISLTALSALLLASTILFAGAGHASAGEPSGFHFVHVSGAFGEFSPGATAVTYQPMLVPDGAHAGVLSRSAPIFGTGAALAVRALLPGHEYGAHVHANACGATGDAAGPHYQHIQDPVTPSVDPAYANPRNEIWLDFTTDKLGNGFAVAKVDWTFGARRPKSVVIHEMHTRTDPGHAGTAGTRLACVNVPF